MKGYVLIIDDNPSDLKVVSKVLSMEDYACATFQNPEEALAWLEENSPRLIILDLMMPQMSGYELIQKLKANPKFEAVPVIIASGKNDLPAVQRAIQLGAYDYIVKPVDVLVLQEKVQKFNTSNPDQFLEIQISHDNLSHAQMRTNIKITSFSEFGMTLISPYPLSNSTIFEIDGLDEGHFGTKKLLVRVISSQPIDSHFRIQVTYVGAPESLRQAIRKSSRLLWVKSKEV